MPGRVKSNWDNVLRHAKSVTDKIDGKVPLDELCPPDFMAKYTEYASISDMFAASGCEMDEAKKPGSEKWNAFVAAHSQFENWSAMLAKAAEERLSGAFK